MRKKTLFGILLIISITLFTLLLLTRSSTSGLRSDTPVDPVRIRQYMQEQVDLGFRIPGSIGSLAFQSWINEKVNGFDLWQIGTQNFTYKGVELRNYWITSTNAIEGIYPSFIIGAHYDSRASASQENPSLPVVGANDGASGVAGILELLNLVPRNLASNFGFVLFDGEDQGSYGMRDNDGSWSWIVGSNQFVADMTATQINKTQAFILLDMIGDDELIITKERRSNVNLMDTFWGIAADLGYEDVFVDRPGPSLIDDHVPFLNAGIPSIDIIDFDYPEWHTLRDNMKNIDPVSVAIVTDVTYQWILNQTPHSSEYSQITSTISSSKTNDLNPFPKVNSSTSETGTNQTESRTPLKFDFIPLFVLLVYIKRKIKNNFNMK